jgi:hypothetical protein
MENCRGAENPFGLGASARERKSKPDPGVPASPPKPGCCHSVFNAGPTGRGVVPVVRGTDCDVAVEYGSNGWGRLPWFRPMTIKELPAVLSVVLGLGACSRPRNTSGVLLFCPRAGGLMLLLAIVGRAGWPAGSPRPGWG